MPAVRGIAMGVRTRLASRCRTRRHRGDHCRSISNSNRKAGDSSWSGFRLMLQSVWVMENMRFAPDKGCARLPRGRRSVMANWKNIGMAFLDGFAPLDNLFQRAVSPGSRDNLIAPAQQWPIPNSNIDFEDEKKGVTIRALRILRTSLSLRVSAPVR